MYKNRHLIYLAMPNYANHESGMMRKVYKFALRDGDERFYLQEQPKKGCSLLASSFNGEWCTAWNNPDTDYWCLVHGDIEPESGFLSKLVDELEENNLDVLHVVSPIKDDRGITSTAVGRNDNEWAMVRRLALKELELLPKTFTIEHCIKNLVWKDDTPFADLLDVNYTDPLCLLPNTGLMLVRRAPWVHTFPGFTIRDRICQYKDGHIWPPNFSSEYSLTETPMVTNALLITQVVSEDWNFGHWLARRGIRVGGTKAIKLGHWGDYVFPNFRWWGQQTDIDFSVSKTAKIAV